MKNFLKNFLIFFTVFLIIAAFFSFYGVSEKKVDEVGLEKLINQIENEEVSAIIIEGDLLKVTLKDNTNEVIKKEPGESFSQLLNNFSIALYPVVLFKRELEFSQSLSRIILSELK